MAAATRLALKLAGRLLAGLVLAFVLFMLAAWIGSSIPRNADWVEPAEGIEIMIETNGVHTAIVMPTVTPIKDWRPAFPAADVAQPLRPYTHVSVSWGEREVFLNTPTWGDLSPITVVRILGFGGEGLLHVAHYVRPAPASDIRPLRLTEAQYRILVARIEQQALTIERPEIYPGYYDSDVFYETGGRYTFTRTCNQWTSDILAAAGVKTGLWTPLSGGVMKWVPRALKRAPEPAGSSFQDIQLAP